MDEVLTMAEIEKRFHGEWVLISEPELDKNRDVVRGTVVYHNTDRDEFDRKSLSYPGQRFAVRYVGEALPEMEFVL